MNRTNEPSQLHMEAIEYARKGYHVFPCLGKKPLTEHGCLDATTDLGQIGIWWSMYPSANIGLATGEASGVMVIDVDEKHNGYESLEQLRKEFRIHDTKTVKTGGGGLHLYFLYEVGIRNKQEFRKGIDIRGEGGYVLAPPSIHPETGQEYTSPNVNWELNSLPIDLIKVLITPELSPVASRTRSQAIIQAGGRHQYMMQVVGMMRRRGLSDEAILAALQAENEIQCDPPLPLKDLERMIETSRGYRVESPIDLFPNGDPDDKSQRLYVDDGQSGRLVKASEVTDSMVRYLKDKSKVKGLSTGFDGLDKMLGGGRRQGEVTCWHAEAKTGKNTLWHYLMYIWLELGIPMAYASRELSPPEEVLPNLLSVATGQNAWLADVGDYAPIVNKWPLYFSDGYGYFPPDQIREWVEHGVEAGIKSFWFDHLHYMLEDPEDHKAASRLIKDLKALAKIKDISIDIIIQPNKLMDGQKLSLNSIKGGAAMGQAIDNLLILERVKDQKNVSKLTLEVARSKLCVPGSIYLQFDPVSTRFVETEAEKEKPQEDIQLISDDIPVADRRLISPRNPITFKTLL